MATPNQDLICCKGCGKQSAPHKHYKLFCYTCVKGKQVEYQRKYREKRKASQLPVACKGCGKPFVSKTGRTWRCPDCALAYMQEYKRKDKARHVQYVRDYRARLGDAYRAYTVKRYHDGIAKMTAEQLAAFRQAQALKTRQRHKRDKDAAYKAYGGYRCACCGVTGECFLTIDHVNNDGAEMRNNRVHGHSGWFYGWLRRNGYPAGFQILCWNCQWGKKIHGTCPHTNQGKA
jgi:uncharacterized Zn finger protein (UPF0148 family)